MSTQRAAHTCTPDTNINTEMCQYPVTQSVRGSAESAGNTFRPDSQIMKPPHHVHFYGRVYAFACIFLLPEMSQVGRSHFCLAKSTRREQVTNAGLSWRITNITRDQEHQKLIPVFTTWQTGPTLAIPNPSGRWRAAGLLSH